MASSKRISSLADHFGEPTVFAALALPLVVPTLLLGPGVGSEGMTSSGAVAALGGSFSGAKLDGVELSTRLPESC